MNVSSVGDVGLGVCVRATVLGPYIWSQICVWLLGGFCCVV